MKSNNKALLIAALAILLIYPLPSLAWSSEDLTFAEFYKVDHTFIYLMAAIATTVAVVMVLTTGPAGVPGAAAIGSWIGGTMGLSGAAATNAGLALLGGGAISAGGLGMVGGAALLSAAMTFTTSVGVDTAVQKYDYNKFIKASESMVVIPLPIADRNIESLENALEVLEEIDKRVPLTSPENTAIIRKAARKIDPNSNGKLSKAERAQKLAFLAVLQLNGGQPGRAKASAYRAYELAKSAGVRRTYPAALYAIASLSDSKPDFNRAIDYLEFSAKYEDTNKLSPAMFAAFMDRLLYRADDIPQSARVWDRMTKLIISLPYDERKAVIESGLVARMMLRSLLLMKRIQGISNSETEEVWNHPNAQSTVSAALDEFKTVSVLTKYVNDRCRKSLAKSDLEDWEMDWKKFSNERAPVAKSYIASTESLSADLAGLVKRQSEFATEQQDTPLPNTQPDQISPTDSTIDQTPATEDPRVFRAENPPNQLAPRRMVISPLSTALGSRVNQPSTPVSAAPPTRAMLNAM